MRTLGKRPPRLLSVAFILVLAGPVSAQDLIWQGTVDEDVVRVTANELGKGDGLAAPPAEPHLSGDLAALARSIRTERLALLRLPVHRGHRRNDIAIAGRHPELADDEARTVMLGFYDDLGRAVSGPFPVRNPHEVLEYGGRIIIVHSLDQTTIFRVDG